MNRISLAVAGLSLVVLATGCGGGGGSVPGPNATPTPVPTATPTAPPATTTSYQESCAARAGAVASGAANPSTYSVQSVPAGLTVTVSGGTMLSGVTPTTVTAKSSNINTAISIAPTNGNAVFQFTCDQRGDGNHTVLYNETADTNGSIGSISTSSIGRQMLRSSNSLATASFGSNVPHFASSGALGRPAFSTSRLVVRYRAQALVATNARPSDIERSLGAGLGIDIGPVHDGIAARVVDVPAGTSIAALAASLRQRADVASVGPERLYYKEAIATPVAPNDTDFNDQQQWSEFAIKANYGWGYTLGSPAVAIAIVDTGADLNHPDLAGSKITYQEKYVDGVLTTTAGAAQDTDGHGTNVAGIAAADTNNANGVAGTGYNTSLQIYKVFPDDTSSNMYSPSANSSDVTQAIYDAVAHHANVINLSLGTCQADGDDPLQRDAVSYAIAHGVVVVAAAGNERDGSGTGSCAGASSTVDFPGAFDGVIAVGASALDDSTAPNVFASAREKVASYSNSGPGLSLVAPGGDPTATESSSTYTGPTDFLHWIFGLYSATAADPNNQCTSKPNCYALFAGTSQATPHVSGVAALMLAANPGLSPAQIKTSLMATADDIGDPNQGAGLLDAYRALAAVTGDVAPPTVPTNSNFVAIAYVPNGTNVPNILDVTYPLGVPVTSAGAFRIADIPSGSSGYKLGVWYDANGDGKVDAGDYFGSSTTTCSASAPCTSAAGIVVHPVAAGFVLN